MGLNQKPVTPIPSSRRAAMGQMCIRDRYSAIKGLRLEARQKLDRIRPKNLGQASLVSGVSPADVAVLMVCLLYTSRCV